MCVTSYIHNTVDHGFLAVQSRPRAGLRAIYTTAEMQEEYTNAYYNLACSAQVHAHIYVINTMGFMFIFCSSMNRKTRAYRSNVMCVCVSCGKDEYTKKKKK